MFRSSFRGNAKKQPALVGKLLLALLFFSFPGQVVQEFKELAAVVGGAFLFRNIARTAVGVVPVLGWAIKGAIGFAGTEAMGHAAIEYFEAGGDIVGVASVVQKARDEAVEAASKAAATPAGGKVIEAARGAGASAFRALRGKGKGAGKGGARG